MKKFSFIKCGSSRYFTGFLAVFKNAASPAWRGESHHSGGRIFAAFGGKKCSNYFQDSAPDRKSQGFRRRRRRGKPPAKFRKEILNFDNFKFFYELSITHYSKFFKKNELEKFTALAANSLALL